MCIFFFEYVAIGSQRLGGKSSYSEILKARRLGSLIYDSGLEHLGHCSCVVSLVS